MHKGTNWKYLSYSFFIAFVLVVIVFSAMFANARVDQTISTPQNTTSEPSHHTKSPQGQSILNFGAREVSIGNPHAPLTVVMYYSLSCPHCHDYQKDELPKIQREYIDKGLVRFVYRDFPTDATAIKAAKIAWCHGTKQYLNFSKKLMETQDKWVPSDLAKIKEAENAFREIAIKELGISPTDFQKCLVNENIESSILRQSFEAQKVHAIDAAPAFLINGKIYKDKKDDINGIVTANVIQEKLAELGIHG